MKLNLDEKGEENEYLLSYLPRIQQETFTVGAVYRHYAGRHVQSVALSHNYLNNRNTKYRNNDESTPDNLTLRLRGVEQKTTLRFENRSYLGRWTLREGAELNYSTYHNKTFAADLSAGSRAAGLSHLFWELSAGLFRGGRLCLRRQAADGFDGGAGRRMRLFGGNGAFLEAAFAPCVGFLCLERQLVGERKRRAFLPVAALYGARL